MNKYDVLVNILDGIRSEAVGTAVENLYLPDKSKVEAINQALARAYIHLFLKVSFGVLSFSDREQLITDGTHDGGIDSFYIDKDNRVIFFIQSKYRITANNFESKLATLGEILKMDINRIVEGESTNEEGLPYNTKIASLQNQIRTIDDIGRYKYKVIILANPPNVSPDKLKQITGGHPTEVFDFERSYSELVFPVISGTFFKAVDLTIALDLSKKNTGTKISYEVATTHHACEITVVFVPTREIARMMSRYKNSILAYNPRSYLELEGHKVNQAIRETILLNASNEFALFNNGITVLSDDTDINEKIGVRNKAQLVLKNPQVINGGQTAYTLSRIYDELLPNSVDPFEGKEVLLKVITLNELENQNATLDQKMELIDRISNASNQQTPVITADKNSNDHEHVQIQKCLFDRYGLLYERKRGEFADGIHAGYIHSDLLIERNLYFRLFFAVLGDFELAIRKRLFMKIEEPLKTIVDNAVLDKLYFTFLCYKRMVGSMRTTANLIRNRAIYHRLHALSAMVPAKFESYPKQADEVVLRLPENWAALIRDAKTCHPELWTDRTHPKTGIVSHTFDKSTWYRTSFRDDVAQKFGKIAVLPEDAEAAVFTINEP